VAGGDRPGEGRALTKSELIELVADRVPHIAKKDVETAINSVFDSMIDALRQEERIEIRGFGSFVVRKRTAREGRNPKTGERVLVPTKRMPFFTVGKELKERVNGNGTAPAIDADGEAA
jgi:integration host factor subunit beta